MFAEREVVPADGPGLSRGRSLWWDATGPAGARGMAGPVAVYRARRRPRDHPGPLWTTTSTGETISSRAGSPPASSRASSRTSGATRATCTGAGGGGTGAGRRGVRCLFVTLGDAPICSGGS